MTPRWLRFLKHCWLDASSARDALGPGGPQRLQERVRQSERHHSGEIRICVEAGLPLRDLLSGVASRARAIEVFSELRVWDTEQNNGVLIYLLMADHAIEIVADRGLRPHVTEQQWREIVQGMGAAFKAGRYEEGLNAAVDAVGELLRQKFPMRSNGLNEDELPNAPVLR